MFDLVPALNVFDLLEETRHVLGAFYVVELVSGPVIYRQLETGCHELRVEQIISTKLLPKQVEQRRLIVIKVL
jgi:hypothetical protein